MKTLFIPTKIKSQINKSKILEISKKLPKNLAIAYSIQYQDIANKIKSAFSKKHKITQFIQVLGCSSPKFPKNTQAVLLISSGKFHAVSLATKNKIPVYTLESNKLKKISKEQIDSLKRKSKASYMRFLNSQKIGILISTKPGQENLKKAIALKTKLKNKDSYLFISDEINSREFENFPDIQSWVNTACPRLDFDSFIININRIR